MTRAKIKYIWREVEQFSRNRNPFAKLQTFSRSRVRTRNMIINRGTCVCTCCDWVQKLGVGDLHFYRTRNFALVWERRMERKEEISRPLWDYVVVIGFGVIVSKLRDTE